MMRELQLVLGLELRGLYGINVLRHTKDPRAKRNGRLMIGVWVFLIALILFYISSLSYGLCALGLGSILPAYLSTIASLLVLTFGFFRAPAILFSQKNQDMLQALPLSPLGILLGRFVFLYLQDLLFTLMILLPGAAICALMTAPAFPFYLSIILGAPLIPLLPLTLSVAFGSLIAALASRMKHKTAAQTLLTVLFVIVVLLLSFGSGTYAEDMTPDAFAQLASRLGDMLAKLYPPADWLGNSANGALLYLLPLAAVSLLPTAGMLWLLARSFGAINTRLFATSATHSYRMEALRADKLLPALIRREFKRYFSSSVYVTNTIIGPIMGTLLAGAALFADLTPLQEALPQLNIPMLIPFAFAAVFSMMTVTSVSISMEGKQLWISQTLPIPPGTWLGAKLLMNLLLYAPFYLLSELLLVIALRPSAWELLWLLLIPAAILLFVTVFGSFINLHLHRFDWTREEQIVKQSAPAAIGGFAGMLLSLLAALPLLLLPPAYSHAVRGAVTALILAATYLLYRGLDKLDPAAL